MQGHFELTLLDAAGYTEQDFQRARKKGHLDALLARLVVDQKCEARNKILHGLVANLFQSAGFGGGDITNPYDHATTHAALGFICLLTTTSEPTYTDTTNQSISIHNVTGTVESTTAGRRFLSDQIVDHSIYKSSDAREAIHFRSKWLYAPGQATSSNINSVGVYFRQQAQSNPPDGYANGITARVRIKDSGGNPVTLNKTATKVLLVEYVFTLVSH
jgi:hypothetical protein